MGDIFDIEHEMHTDISSVDSRTLESELKNRKSKKAVNRIKNNPDVIKLKKDIKKICKEICSPRHFCLVVKLQYDIPRPFFSKQYKISDVLLKEDLIKNQDLQRHIKRCNECLKGVNDRIKMLAKKLKCSIKDLTKVINED